MLTVNAANDIDDKYLIIWGTQQPILYTQIGINNVLLIN